MVHTDPSLPPPMLDGRDALVGDALAAWLAAVGVTEKGNTFSQATEHCVSLCQVFAMFAPHHLSDKDYLHPSKPTSSNPPLSRQQRYNTRRLARSLAEWSQVRSRSSSPSSADAFASSSDDESSQPIIPLSYNAKNSIRSAVDAGCSPQFARPSVLLALAEVLLCAAVHSHLREMFINHVLTLSPQHQQALAQSLRRTTGEEPRKQEENVLNPVVLNDENVPDENRVPEEKSQKLVRSVATARASLSDSHGTPRGIPLEEYKALAVERDNLRRKLIAADLEKEKARETSDALRRSLDEAGDRIRELKVTEEQREKEMVSKSKALNDLKTALRDAHVSAEEIDLLRAKAASAEQLEASLKRASQRLEDVADMRRSNKDLEAQVAAFRDNEDRSAKHTEYLQSQVDTSNERVEQLMTLSDNLSADLEDKENRISTLSMENKALKEKLETANKQLASMLVKSTYTSNQQGTTSSSSRTDSASPKEAEKLKAGLCTALVEESTAIVETGAPEFDADVVSEHLFKEVGVKMDWRDIVDCVRGVMEAMDDLDEMDRAQESGAGDETHLSHSSSSSDMNRSGIKRFRESGQSFRTASASDIDAGSDVESKESVLPAFRDVDSKMKTASGGVGDEFDFAANHINVEEIPVVQRALATVPENREGFEANGIHSDADDSSYHDGFSSERMDEAADETINATVEPARAASLGDVHTATNAVVRNASFIRAEGMSSEAPNSSLLESTVNTDESVLGSIEIDSPQSYCQSLSTGVKRTTSMAFSMRGSLSRSPSHSDATRAIVRQARSELGALQSAMDLMRAERESSASINALVQQLNDAREELRLAQVTTTQKEEENSDLRRELNLLIKEHDSVTMQKESMEQQEAGVLQEKERLVVHLKEALEEKDEELKIARAELGRVQKQVEMLTESEATLGHKVREADVIGRAQEVEVARLTAKLEASELLSARLNAAVNQTDGLNSQMTRQRENHLNDMAAAARREKELAMEARDEARRVAESHASVLDDVRATAAAAAAARAHDDKEKGATVRKGTRFGEFWRRLLHRERTHVDYSMPASTISMPPSSENRSKKSVRTE